MNLPKKPINNIFEIDDFKIQIKICIDAITAEGKFPSIDEAKILIIPSLSKNTEPFKALAQFAKFNELPVIYANSSSAGGSFISGAFSKFNNHWFTDKSSTLPAPKDSEYLLSVTIDLDAMFSKVSTVRTSNAIEVNEIINFIYMNDINYSSTRKSILKYINGYPNANLEDIENNCEDSILAMKLKYLRINEDNQTITKSLIKNTLEYVKISSMSLSQLILSQSKTAFNYLTLNRRKAEPDNNYYRNISYLSDKISVMQNPFEERNIFFEDESMFTGRDDELSMLSQFFNSENNVLLLHGLRGIGKTKLIKNISPKVLPSPFSPWNIKYIEFNMAIGFELFFNQLIYKLNLPFIELNNKNTVELVNEVLDNIDLGTSISIVIDDFQNCTDIHGNFLDTRLKDFMTYFINQIQKKDNIKLILTSNRRIQKIENIGVSFKRVSRLNDEQVKFIINYCYRKITNSTRIIRISQDLLKNIYGNPLAALLVAQLIDEEDKLAEFEAKGKVFERYQEQMISYLLGEVKLSKEENDLLKLLSVSKTAVDIDYIRKENALLLNAVDNLENRFLIERKENHITIHPVFKDEFYGKLNIKERADLHKSYAMHYEDIYKTHQDSSKLVNPELLSNVVFHYGGSLNYKKAMEYKLYIEELIPIANQLYKDKNYEDALKFYKAIYDTIGIQRTDLLIKMAQSYVYCSDIENAEHFFSLAVKNNPRGAYIWANFSISLSSKKEYIIKAIEYANEAENIYNKHGNSLNWEIALIKFAQARAIRYENPEQALDLYSEVVELEPTNCYYLCINGLFAFDNDEDKIAAECYKKAASIKPNYRLVGILHEKIKKIS